MERSNNGAGQSSGLSDPQSAAIGHLLEGKTIAESATILEIAPNTIHQWHKQAEFIVQLNAARHDAFQASIERLRALAPKALSVLEKSLVSEDEVTRLRVAELILKTVKLTDIPLPTGPLTVEEFDRDQSYQKTMSDALNAFSS